MTNTSLEEWEELERQFIIGVTPLTDRQKELVGYIEWLEDELRKMDIKKRRINATIRAIWLKLAEEQPK